MYFDTPDLRLLTEGISLRVRRIGKRYRQTIKLIDGQAGRFDRAEWEQEIRGPGPDLVKAKRTALRNALNGELSGSLRPIFETRVRRARYRLTSRGQRVELAIDRGAIDTGKRCRPICELELELLHWRPGQPFRVGEGAQSYRSVRLCVKAKADRGYELVRNDIDPIDKATDVHLSSEITTKEAFRIIGNGCLRQLIADEPAMIAGDVEALHQMRVALRRLRAAISAFSNVVADSEWRGIKAELRWITGELGPARDLDVLSPRCWSRCAPKIPRNPACLASSAISSGAAPEPTRRSSCQSARHAFAR